MTNDIEALRELNQKIMEAENRGDRDWLASILAPRLAFQRANEEVEDQDSFLQNVTAGGDRVSRIIEPIQLYGNRAVVHFVVTTGGRQIDNLQVLVRRVGEWKLLSWANERV